VASQPILPGMRREVILVKIEIKRVENTRLTQLIHPDS
jgi:hypothetical protein